MGFVELEILNEDPIRICQLVYFLFLAETFMMCVNVFLYNGERNFSWIRQNMRNFPIDPHYKNCPLMKRYRHDVIKVGDFYNGGLLGSSLFFVGSY